MNFEEALKAAGFQSAEFVERVEQTQVKHTALPWNFQPYGNAHRILADNGITVIAGIPAPAYIPDQGKTDKADAAFIVKACNSHYELLEALEMVRDADEDCKKDGLQRWCTDIARQKIDAAIAKAEGATP